MSLDIKEKLAYTKRVLQSEKIIPQINKDFNTEVSLIESKDGTRELEFEDDKYIYRTMYFLDDISPTGSRFKKFKKHLKYILFLQSKYNIDFEYIGEKNVQNITGDDWIKRIHKLQNIHINPFKIKNNIIQSPKIKGTPISLNNINIPKFKKYLNSFFKKTEDYHLFPSDFIDAVVIDESNNYILIDHRQLRPYFFNNIFYKMYTMAMPDDKVLLIDKIINQSVDEETIKKLSSMSKYEADIINRGSDSKYLINSCFDLDGLL